MKKILVVVDMQNDFITGPLGTPEAVGIVDRVCEKIREGGWDLIIRTMDSHRDDLYLHTQEGAKLPIKHCIVDTEGWLMNAKVEHSIEYVNPGVIDIIKSNFGSVKLCKRIEPYYYCHEAEVTLVGVCTDICVVSNALLLKAYFPEMRIVVDASCCAGSTPEKHLATLEVLKSCQVDVVNE